jgi:hypothetical protein
MLFQVVLMALVAGLALRSLRWSLDSPVLRRAWRRRQLSYSSKIGLMAVLALSIRFARMYGEGLFSPATIVGGLFFLLAGTVVVLFSEFVIQDMREVFWLVAVRFRGASVEEQSEPDPARRCSRPERSCLVERTCSEAPQPCGARGTTKPWRPAELPRKRQHR